MTVYYKITRLCHAFFYAPSCIISLHLRNNSPRVKVCCPRGDKKMETVGS